MKITKHFSHEEFRCKDGTDYPVSWKYSRLVPLCEALEVIRKELGGRSITITSGYRTPDYNKKVGGVKSSEHMYGQAADIQVKGVSARKVAEVVRQLIKDGMIPQGGVGDYSSFCHYDIRGYNARWRGR